MSSSGPFLSESLNRHGAGTPDALVLLMEASHVGPAAGHAHFSCPNELGRCRAALAAARDEIGRLRRELAETRLNNGWPRRVDPRPSEPVTEPDPRALPPKEPKAYAPDPLGKPTELRDRTPPEPVEEVRAVGYSSITNLGSLLDVLS